MATPMMPPAKVKKSGIHQELAPDIPFLGSQALRMPISLRLSITDTSMIFMTPMPPTSKEIPAIAPSSRVRLLAEAVIVLVIWSVEVRVKSSVPPRGDIMAVLQ